MVKRRNTNSRRKVNSRIGSTVSRIATGVPVSKRNSPRDPPMLPHVLAFPVRVRWHIMIQKSTQPGYHVIIAGTPTGRNIVNHYFHPTSGTYTPGGGLTLNEIFIAAAMRLYGVDISANTSSANYVTTDFAIQKVVFYGPSDPTYDGDGVFLAIDFGDDIPGFVGRDAPARNRRAVVSATPPRLSWHKVVQTPQDPSVSYHTGISRTPLAQNSGQAFPGSYLGADSWSIGVLDFTVLVRRSAIAEVGPFTRASATTVSTTESPA